MSNKIRFVELQELCNSITDCHHSTPLYIESGKIVIRNFNIKKGRLQLDDISYTDEENYLLRTSRAIPEAGDLIITREAPMGEVCIIPENLECCLGQRMVLLKPNRKKVDSNYLLYTLMSQYVQTHISKSEGTGSIVSNLRIPVLKELHIPIFDIERQTTIGKILSDIDSKIALNNRINAELEAMAKTIYDYWFVQFDFPNAEGKPYKSSGGKMVWNEELKREVPEGWEVKNIGEVATVKAGGDKPAVISSDKTKECPIPIYSNGISNDGLYGYTNKAIINSQSVTISARGTIGFCVLRNKPFVPIIRLISLTPNFKGSAKYFYEALTHFIFENSGSVQQQLTVPQVQSIKILYPNEDILKMFDNITSPMIDKIEILKEENQQLSSLRDWLLPMLMNGQVVSTTLNNHEQEWSGLMAAEPEVNYGSRNE
jgi:type I restriction enzyme S subunit